MEEWIRFNASWVRRDRRIELGGAPWHPPFLPPRESPDMVSKIGRLLPVSYLQDEAS